MTNILNINFGNKINDELILQLEEILLNLKNIDFFFDDNNNNVNLIIIKKDREINNLKDVAIEGKIIKEFGIKNRIFTNKNYISFFEIKKLNNEINNDEKTNIKELDKLIVKVPKNDPKLLNVLEKLNNIKKTKK